MIILFRNSEDVLSEEEQKQTSSPLTESTVVLAGVFVSSWLVIECLFVFPISLCDHEQVQ